MRPGRSTTRAAARGDGVAKLAVSVVAVDAQAELAAGGEVGLARRLGRRGRERLSAGGVSLEDRQRLADDEAELCVERERAVVVGRLDEPDARRTAIALALAAPPPSAPGRRRRPVPSGSTVDRADSGDHPALVDERAAEHLAGALGDEPGDTRRSRASRRLVKRVNSGELGSTGRLWRLAIDSNAS